MTSENVDVSTNDLSLKHFHVNAECPHGANEHGHVLNKKDNFTKNSEMSEEEKIMRKLEVLQSRGKILRYFFKVVKI